ncbi:DUF262 domain-containing protein [Spirulina sp. CCNP1310]|uniref:DUF262 domain-containing protein n=1 Tax=Spirulina sp. CCNP1310 TaxID=3110249 RepID=UPI002B203A35|nr:DUF262 domain-containing protein [Spirulina sp. CCNP1310]MEA5418685.1 DUF262 domain-containing protein [Spirulina sp. CCNP1310]
MSNIHHSSDTQSNSQKIEGDIEENVSPSSYSITSYNADYPVDGLVKRIQRQDIHIPEFQRSYVWKKEQASRFIESLLLGLPVPGIFLAKEPKSNRLIVIDGQQRLKTLQYFYEGKFPIKSNEDQYQDFFLVDVAEQFDGKSYATLLANDQRQLDDSILPATIVRQEEPKEEFSTSMYYIFERLNTGGTQLLSQEIRASIYYGEFNQLLNELNKYEVWQKIFQGKENSRKPDPSKRMKDRELILRFTALYFAMSSYKNSMKDFLNDFMMSNRNLQKYSALEITQVFQKTINTIYQAIGIKAFRPRRGLHAAVFDAVMVGVAHRLENGEIEQKSRLNHAYDELLQSEDFLASSINSRQMTNIKNVQARIYLATKKFQSIP